MRQEDGVAMEMYMLLPVLYALRRYDRVCAADTPTGHWPSRTTLWREEPEVLALLYHV